MDVAESLHKYRLHCAAYQSSNDLQTFIYSFDLTVQILLCKLQPLENVSSNDNEVDHFLQKKSGSNNNNNVSGFPSFGPQEHCIKCCFYRKITLPPAIYGIWRSNSTDRKIESNNGTRRETQFFLETPDIALQSQFRYVPILSPNRFTDTVINMNAVLMMINDPPDLPN